MLRRAGSLALLLVLWEAGALVAQDRMVPTASAVLAALAHEALKGPLLHHLSITLLRVAAAFLVAMVIGGIIGIILGRSRRLDALFDSWLILLLNLPALVVIILAYVWFGLTEAAAIGAVAVTRFRRSRVTLREGARGPRSRARRRRPQLSHRADERVAPRRPAAALSVSPRRRTLRPRARLEDRPRGGSSWAAATASASRSSFLSSNST